MTISAILLGVTQIIFVLNIVQTLRKGKFCGQNPWECAALEWSAQYPIPHGNWGPKLPVVKRWPYDYSVPGVEADFIMQTEETPAGAPAEASH